MPPRPYDHPVLQVFTTIRRIDDGVRDALAECLPDGVTVPQFEVLRLLELRGDGLGPAEIANGLHANKSGLTATLQRLEAAGLIALEPSAEDGRKKRVRLTASGRAAYVRSIAGIRPRMDHLREAFTLDEFREVLPFLKALDAWLEERDWA